MSENAPSSLISVFIPEGTPDISATARSHFRGLFPRKFSHSSARIGSSPPLGEFLRVNVLNPGSIALFGGISTLYARDAFGLMFLPSSRHSIGGVWGSEALRSLIAGATLHVAGATVAFAAGQKTFYRPFAPVTMSEHSSEAIADHVIERVAAILVAKLREMFLDKPRVEPMSLQAAQDYVISVLIVADVLPSGYAAELLRWSADLDRIGYKPQSVPVSPNDPPAFLTPLQLCLPQKISSALPPKPPVHRVRAAMCIKGEGYNMEGGAFAINTLRPYFPDDNMHVFLYTGAFQMGHWHYNISEYEFSSFSMEFRICINLFVFVMKFQA